MLPVLGKNLVSKPACQMEAGEGWRGAGWPGRSDQQDSRPHPSPRQQVRVLVSSQSMSTGGSTSLSHFIALGEITVLVYPSLCQQVSVLLS